MRFDLLAVIGFDGIIAEGLRSVLNGSRFRIKIQSKSLEEFWKINGAIDRGLRGIIIDANNHPPLQSSDLESIRRWSATVKVVLVADESRFEDIKAVARDADSVVPASGEGAALLKSLDLVLLGQRVYPAGLFQSTWAPEPVSGTSSPLIDAVDDDMPNGGTSVEFSNALRNLSEREVQVVSLLCDGSPNKVIARKLGISEATVKVHVKAILRKTRARNRTEAAVLFRSAMRPEETLPEMVEPELPTLETAEYPEIVRFGVK